MFRSTGANAVAKNQTRLAYEDKRDLYCIIIYAKASFQIPPNLFKYANYMQIESRDRTH